MKTKLALITAVVGLFAMTSCKHAPSEETTKAVTEFETAWSALGTTATTWGEELKATAATCTEHCTMHDSMKMDGMDAAAMTKCTEMATNCKNDKAAMDAMWGEFEAFSTGWAEATAAFGEWKGKMATMTDEEAKAALAGFQTKMDESKAKVEGWGAAYTTAKETAMKNMEACANMQKMMAEQASAKDGKKK